MPDPNFAEIQARVKREAKMESTEATIVAFVKDSINRAYYDLAREQPWPELLLPIEVTLVAGVLAGTLKGILPNNFLRQQRVRFYDASGPGTWPLSERGGIVQPAPVYGMPTAYQIQSNDVLTDPFHVIIIEPVIGVDIVADRLQLEYYKSPPRLTADADVLVSYNLFEEVIKRAVVYCHIWHNKLGQANAVMAQTMRGQQSALKE